jgi:hypothetical protein
MEGFVGWCESNASRLGYFAALYTRITKAVEAALLQGTVFKDDVRMAQLDVTFASRYLTALNGYFHPDAYPGISRCWLAAFTGAEAAGDTVVQHMLSGEQVLTIAGQDALVAGLILTLFTPPEPLESVAQIVARQENPNTAQVVASLMPP